MDGSGEYHTCYLRNKERNEGRKKTNQKADLNSREQTDGYRKGGGRRGGGKEREEGEDEDSRLDEHSVRHRTAESPHCPPDADTLC